MSRRDDFGLAGAITVISRTLYGIENVPKTPSGKLEYSHRQMIATQYPQLLAALLYVQAGVVRPECDL